MTTDTTDYDAIRRRALARCGRPGEPPETALLRAIAELEAMLREAVVDAVWIEWIGAACDRPVCQHCRQDVQITWDWDNESGRDIYDCDHAPDCLITRIAALKGETP